MLPVLQSPIPRGVTLLAGECCAFKVEPQPSCGAFLRGPPNLRLSEAAQRLSEFRIVALRPSDDPAAAARRIHALGWLFFVLAGPPLSKVKLY